MMPMNSLLLFALGGGVDGIIDMKFVGLFLRFLRGQPDLADAETT